jgi:hypothetical protein
MTARLHITYLGFVAGPGMREYAFVVKDGGEKPREFRLSIANEAFLSHRVRYQDAPDICSRRLQAEIAGPAGLDASAYYTITEAELEAYRVSHAPKPKPLWIRKSHDEA